MVLISLTAKGRKAFMQHQRFHQAMIASIVEGLSDEEQEILEKALRNASQFFRTVDKKQGKP